MGATSIQSAGLAAVTIPDATAATAAGWSYDVGFRQRLYGIVSLIAIAVLNETGGSTARLNFARAVLADPVGYVDKCFCFAVPMDGVTGSSSSDQDIANRVGDIWTTLAVGM